MQNVINADCPQLFVGIFLPENESYSCAAPAEANIMILFAAPRTPDESDRPSFPSTSAAAGLPDPNDEDEGPVVLPDPVPPADPEAIRADLASRISTIYDHAEVTIVEGTSARELVDAVLPEVLELSVLQETWVQFVRDGPQSDLWFEVDNLRRKYEHAEFDEPDTPDPNAPPVEADSPPVEADSPQSGGGEQANLVGRTAPSILEPGPLSTG